MKNMRSVVSECFDDVVESDFNPDIVLGYGYECYELGERIGARNASCIMLAGIAIAYAITIVGKRVAYKIIDKKFES